MKFFGYFYAIGAAMVWGLAYAIDQKILEKSSPFFILFANSVITLAITLPLIIINGDLKSELQLSRAQYQLIFLAQLLTLLASVFILSSIKSLGASLSSIFEISYPIFVIIFSLIIYGGSFNLFFWIGSILMFIGAAIIITRA